VVALPGADGLASSPLVSADGTAARDVAMIAWLVDAASLANGLSIARARGITQLGLDALGGEDPRVWPVLSAKGDEVAVRRALETMPRRQEQTLLGDGVEVRVLDEERDGKAQVVVSRDGSVRAEAYRVLPADVTVVRRGRPAKKTIALTFDDGPDPEFTPAVLDILARKGVTATFFVIGSRVEREPELAKRLTAQGHEIGNHSFSHADLSRVPGRRADLEIRATNLLLEATTGRATALFRPPYRSDDHPDAEDVVSILAGQRNGVSVVTSTIDPRDWAGTRARAMVDQVLAQAEADGSGVVLLHDGGGDRRETIAALEPIIDGLRARGFRFVQIHDVFGGAPMDLVNPPATGAFDRQVAHVLWRVGAWALRFLQAAALLALVLGLVRVGSLILFALVDLAKHGRRGVTPSATRTAVSVVIPAYNEAKVIERTIRSVLASTGVEIEVIVLDDGSKDGTGDVVASTFLRDPRVRLVRLVNGGKAAALNKGFRLATHPIVVALDADTIFLPTTIAELAAKFTDAQVGAVAGRAVVGNADTTMARWQALEYVIGQAVERRAWHALGLVSVVPGAVGAWRRDAVIAAGGFARDTLAEDCDLTIDLQVRGWRVEFAPDATALTEAPEGLATLVKQRFRWSYGVLQAVWKHRRAAFRRSPNGRRVGLMLLPTVLVAHLATPLLAPAADLAAAVALYLGFGASVLPFAIASLVADAAITVFAMVLDRAPAKLAWDWLVFRALYRWVLFASLVKAIVAALKGGAVGWGKLVRKGTVHLPARAAVAGAAVLVAALSIGCTPLPPMTPDEARALGVTPHREEAATGEDDDDKAAEAPEPNVDAIVERAEAARKAGDLGAAEKLAREAITLDASGYPYAYVVLGDVASARGDQEAALARFQKAVALDPNDAWSTTRLSETLVALHREGDARDVLRRYVATHPDADDEMLVALGNAERDLGDRARAETAYRNASLRAGGKNADALYGLALVAQERKRPAEVVRALRSLLELDPARREDLASDPGLAKARKSPAVRSLLARPRATKPSASKVN
jgi:cellulose synthase/poly-beta-1,6-N-acetylglucosamine synthase-like glycosyltransferase/peptidoglycan/xylan/chitin deacetylase (PgdA/CDA1 family)